MALRYPNRTGEVGTYNSGGTVTLPSTDALPGLRTFAAAASAGKLAATDHLGLHVKRSGNDSIWLVAMAQYSSGAMAIIETEDSAGTLSDGDQVEVTAVLTAKMLDSASLSYAPPTPLTQTGPDWWTINTTRYGAGTTWNDTDECYEHDTTIATNSIVYLKPVTAGANANWGASMSPTEISLEIWVPDGMNVLDYEHANFGINLNQWGGLDVISSAIGSSAGAGAWHQLTLTSDDLSGVTEVTGLVVSSLDGSGTFKLRNITVTD